MTFVEGTPDTSAQTPKHTKQPPRGRDKYQSDKATENLVIDRYLWMYINHVGSDEIQRAAGPYKVRGIRVGDCMNLTLTVSDHRGDPSDSFTKLTKLVTKYDEQTKHDMMTVTDRAQQRKVDSMAQNDKVSLIYREDDTVHVITEREKMVSVKTKIRDTIGLSSTTATKQASQSKKPEVKVKKMNYKWDDRTTIHIFEANITTLHVDVIVNATNPELRHAGGVAAAISRASGSHLQQECKQQVAEHGKLPVSGTYVSRGYNLPCNHVVHVVGPMWNYYTDKSKCEIALQQAFTNCLQEADKLQAKTIAIPAVSSGRIV